ncbi:MAG TPA: hypothetical protein DCE41_19070 [Cytophagales bacterium]|nr:hypothetical protein [Cytophagales bacterium]
MSTLEIIASLREIGVVPRLQDGNLKLVGKTAALSAELLAAVRDGKAKLLAFLEESQADTRQEQITPITQQAHYPLTPSQRRMWVLSQFDGGNQAYNIGNGFYLQGEVNATVLEEAFRVCIAKHESLRTTFAEVADEPVQVVHDELPFALEQTTLVGSADVKAALRQEYSALYHHQFNLEQGPLMQVKLIHLGGESHALLFNMHHIISDGWSVGLLVQEVMGYYREKCLGNSITTQALSIQYKDYAAWLAEKFDGSFGQKAKAYWQGKQLEGVEPLVLPYDRPRPQQTTFAGASTRMYLSPSQKEALDQLARQQHTTLFNLYRALLSLTLHKVSGQDQLILGTPIAGRSVMQLHDQIGLYVNTLPLYSQITSATPFTAYLKELSRDSLDTFNYQDYPLDRIIEDVGVARDASRGALFDVMMVVQNTALGDGSIDIKKQHGFEMSYLYEYLEGGQKVDKEDVSAKFDMALEFSQDIEGRPYVEWEYNTDLFDKATIQRLQRAFGFVMQQVLDQPELSVDEVMLIDPKEQDTILHVFNQPIGEGETHSLVHLLQPAIAKHADRVAVRDAHNALTYGELWQQAQGYAQAILQSTEAPRVGIYMQRSVEILPAILGVLLAGKTYVPIDVKYP